MSAILLFQRPAIKSALISDGSACLPAEQPAKQICLPGSLNCLLSPLQRLSPYITAWRCCSRALPVGAGHPPGHCIRALPAATVRRLSQAGMELPLQHPWGWCLFPPSFPVVTFPGRSPQPVPSLSHARTCHQDTSGASCGSAVVHSPPSVAITEMLLQS